MASDRNTPSCQLYLVTPPRLDLPGFVPAFAAALDAGAIACAELALDDADEAAWHRAIAALRPLAQGRDVAFLLAGHARLAAETGCDGVRIVAGEDIAAARRTVGAGMMLGVSVEPASVTARHDAITAAERGADFVAFGAPGALTAELAPDSVVEHLGWWAEMIEVPCVAFAPADPLTCARLAAAGADFIAVREAVWDHPAGAAEGVTAVLAALRSDPHSGSDGGH